MTIPISGGRVTAPFDEPRPVEGPKTHDHGALDVAGGDGQVRAPAAGIARAYIFIRYPGEDWMFRDKPEIQELPFRRYWYDVFGGLIVVTEPSGIMHLMTHFFSNQLQRGFGRLHVYETSKETRFPCTALVSDAREVRRGEVVSKVGNAGYSSGPHIHWEVHHQSDRLDDYPSRINPSRYID